MSGSWGGTGDIHPLRVRISFTLDSVKAQTGFVLRDQSLAPSNPQDCAENVGAFVEANMRGLFYNIDRFDGVDVLDLTTGEGGGYSFNNIVGSLPNNNAEALPSYVTASIAMKGELRRRYGQGRMLMPVRAEHFSDRNVLNGAGVAAFNGFITAMQSQYMETVFSTKRYRLITVHGVIPPRAATPTAPARPEVPPTWYNVTSLRLNSVMSFLRSRKVGVGT